MSKEKSEKKERKEKKDKSLVSEDGVKKVKKEKKEKKEKKARRSSAGEDATERLVKALDDEKDLVLRKKEEQDEDGDVDMDVASDAEVRKGGPPLIGQLVPFANPLADEKGRKKIMKGVKKAAKQRCLKRGVKEVVKTIRKTPTSAPSSSFNQAPVGVAVLAADISPMDVISHLPVLCEDHNVPYVYVQSRAELGAASSTKRPTSVVMLMRERGGKKGKAAGEKDGDGDEEAEREYAEAFADLVKMVQKASRSVKV